jgi:hypothetical protein
MGFDIRRAGTVKILIVGVILGLASTSTSTIAHSDIPQSEWCSSGRIVAVGEFELYPGFNPSPSAAYCPESGSGLRDCGVFDDDYGNAKAMAQQGCGAHARRAHPTSDIGSVVFVAEHPASFLSPTHHDDYQFNQGLRGVCVRCEARPPVLPIALPPRE